MAKKSDYKLFLFFILMLAAYIFVDKYRVEGKSGGLRTKLVHIDTAKVSKVIISKDKEQVVLNKENAEWFVLLSNGKEVTALPDVVKSVLENIIKIKPSRLASKNPAKYDEFQVSDSLGTRIQIFEGVDETLDIILGNFGVLNRQEFYTFVRLKEDFQTYTAKNFMATTIPNKTSRFRNTSILEIDPDSLKQINYYYHADSSFSAKKKGSSWYIDNKKANNIKMTKFIYGLSNISNNNFYDNITELSEFCTVELINNKNHIITIKAFITEDSTMIINSTNNIEAFFSDANLVRRIFKGKSELTN